MVRHPVANLYRCNGCTHVFSLSDAPIREHYDDNYYESEHKKWFEHPNYWLFRKLEGALAGSARSVLDVGCGRGDFLKFLKARRPNLQLIGIDPSAQSTTPQYEFLRSELSEFKTRSRFDAVVTLAVIEHVDDPKVFVARLVELLNPGGQLFVMTVKEDSILFGIAKIFHSVGISVAFDRLYSIHHLNHFTTKSLRRLLLEGGLVVDRTLTHNSPLSAVDIPVNSRLLDGILRAGVGVLSVAGRLTNRAYLQTAISHKAK